MTKYTVTWHDDAQNQLARFWNENPNRAAVTQAATAIDAELRFDPATKGLPQPDGLRSLYVPPLQVLFAFNEPDRKVEVVLVRFLPTPPRIGANGQNPADGTSS